MCSTNMFFNLYFVLALPALKCKRSKEEADAMAELSAAMAVLESKCGLAGQHYTNAARTLGDDFIDALVSIIGLIDE